ncbi:MAG: GcrA cell cycle regulator, partial [Sphingomonas sp.]|nr:GcrA cell cycle regulator [Sphingomonas sp.]
MSWTEERIATLKKMWESGMTASQIAEELGGISRNAVIGKAHRLGLQSRPSPVKGAEGDTKKKAAPRAKAAPAPSAAAAPAPAPTPPPAPKPAPAPAPAPAPEMEASDEDEVEEKAPRPIVRSVGPGGFIRQNPADQAPPATPAPPRR